MKFTLLIYQGKKTNILYRAGTSKSPNVAKKGNLLYQSSLKQGSTKFSFLLLSLHIVMVIDWFKTRM